jgi:hypothetical protein
MSRNAWTVGLLFLGVLAGSVNAVRAHEDAPTEMVVAPVLPVLPVLEEVEQPPSCFDSYDCVRTVEHCLNRRCERTTRPCHFNYECGGADTCRRGVCRR